MLAALLLMLLAPAADQRQPAKPAPKTFTVTIDATRFEPAILNVKQGDRIVFTNKDLFPHTVTSKQAGFDSGKLDAGQSWTLMVKKIGAFDYACTFHTTMGGTIRVREVK